MPTTQPGVITSNGIVTVVTTPPGSVATTARPTATPTPTAAAVLKKARPALTSKHSSAA